MQSSTPQSNLDQLEQELTEFFSKVDFVKVAYLFGSTVRKEAICLSDIDIAVLFDNNLSIEASFDFQLKLIGELTTLLKTNNVDLVALNDSPLLLTYNAIRTGIILKSDEPVRVRFETKIMSRYLDEQFHIKRHTRESLKRIARGGFR
jgi:predicted nucleotidyltransferase